MSVLGDSPPEPKSAKISKPVAASRRGRLSRAAKEPTPSKKPSLKKSNAEEPSIKMSPSYKKTPNGTRVLRTARLSTSSKTPNSRKSSSAEVSQMSQSFKNTPSGVFEITERSESKTPKVDKTAHASKQDESSQDSVDASNNSSSNVHIRSVSNKKRRSTRGKENTPCKMETQSDFPDGLSISIQEDAMESVITDSRRMSIHEPSPAVHVSPENLSMGMVPAQFSPFITSARGKDKYSLQKRRKLMQ